ncbi:hypothetical protein [Clostridium hydrogeniformans]|uniref:hypothetical protein n=1 Tax=Clostridium hydrogeniformans TaxID=349933 RepID=UPI000481DE85|nr:hypothetical protein [Clostridium hydrogeniformans]
MSLRGIGSSLLLAINIGALPYFIGISGTLIIISLSYIFLGIIYIKDKEMFHAISRFKNIDRYIAYEKKDKDFKEYVKENPYSYFLIGGLVLYLAYKFMEVGYSVKYSLIFIIFIIANYLVEVYAMTTSDDWLGYRKKSLLIGMIIVFLILFLF